MDDIFCNWYRWTTAAQVIKPKTKKAAYIVYRTDEFLIANFPTSVGAALSAR